MAWTKPARVGRKPNILPWISENAQAGKNPEETQMNLGLITFGLDEQGIEVGTLQASCRDA
jgi:hypothetical protein